MLKLYFVGDLHLHDVSPSSRIDDYSQAILDKLSQVFTKAKESNVDAIIFEGDIFHKPSGISVRYLNKVIDVFKEAHCPCYSVIGNHDVQSSTGFPVDNEVASVTAIGTSGLYCDALSTSLFVMGVQKAISFWRAVSDFDFVMITKGKKAFISKGLADSFKLAKSSDLAVIVVD